MQSALSVTQIKRYSITLYHRIVHHTTPHHTAAQPSPLPALSIPSGRQLMPARDIALLATRERLRLRACLSLSILAWNMCSAHVWWTMIDYERGGMREEEKGRENEKEGMIREREESVGLLMRQSRASLEESHR